MARNPLPARGIPWLASFAGLLIGLLLGGPAGAQVCTGSLVWTSVGSDGNEAGNCFAAFPPFRCYKPQVGEATVTLQPGCDPSTQSCNVTVEVPVTYPGNHLNDPTLGGFSYSFATLTVRRQGGPTLGSCGVPGAVIAVETGKVRWTVGCGAANPVYDVTATSCPCPPFIPCTVLCPKTAVKTVDLSGQIQSACAPPPPPCEDDCACNRGGSGAGAGPGGRGAGPPPPPGSGPQVLFRYKAGGVGHPGYPGSAQWRVTLGRYWSHEGAIRIVEAVAGDPSVVWLLDESGTFTRFEDTVPTAVPNEYEAVDPANDYRTLTQTASGWELRDLEGGVQSFDAAGRWIRTEDRNGNALVASYDAAGRLAEIAKPDGRRETFDYYPMGDPSEGKLMAITLWGVLDADSLVWTYEWTGDDLTRIDRPDGRALVYEYDDAANPGHPAGYLTRQRLIGDQGGSRLLQAWEYDAGGNVAAAWKGTENKADAGVVDRFDFSYDALFEPSETTVTDPHGQPTTYTVDYVGRRFRTVSITGPCPTCGFGPETSFEYGDAANPAAANRHSRRPRGADGARLQRGRPQDPEDRGGGDAPRAHHHLGLRPRLPGLSDGDRAALGRARGAARHHPGLRSGDRGPSVTDARRLRGRTAARRPGDRLHV